MVPPAVTRRGVGRTRLPWSHSCVCVLVLALSAPSVLVTGARSGFPAAAVGASGAADTAARMRPAAGAGQDPAPIVRWTSHPLKPNDTAMVYGSHLDRVTSFQLCAASQHSPTAAAAPTATVASACTSLAPLQRSVVQGKFTLPDGIANDVFAVRACTNGAAAAAECATVATLNEPEVWWTQGDMGDSASPGGWVALFGRSLAFDAAGDCVHSAAPSNATRVRVRLTPMGTASSTASTAVDLTAFNVTCFSLRVALPSNLAVGDYSVALDTGLPATASLWAVPPTGPDLDATVRVVPGWDWPAKPFLVDADYHGNISAALDAAGRAGGGEVVLSARDYDMGDCELLLIPDAVTLRGAGRDATRLTWASNTHVPMGPLVSGNARFRLLDATMLMTSAAYTVVQVGPDSTRSVIAGMNITQAPTIVRKGPGFEILGNQYTVVDNYMVHGANQCDVYYTNNCAVSVVRGNNGVFSRNHVVCRCQGFAWAGTDRVMFEDNNFTSVGLIHSQGNGWNTFTKPPLYTRYLSFARNLIVGQPKAKLDQETFTTDGTGGGWFGPLSSVSGATASVANATGNYTGGVMIVLAGAGAGQWRRILQQRGNSYVLEAALDPTPEPDTNVTVVPFRSHMLLTGNTIVNGTTMQFYGTSLNCIMADNTAHVMGSGFSAHGESYQGGVQPSNYGQFLRNSLHASVALRVTSDHGPPFFNGTYCRAQVIRGNELTGNTSIDVWNATVGAIVEHNRVQQCVGKRAVDVGPEPVDVFVRGNTVTPA